MRVAGARVSVPLYLTEHVRSLGTFGCLMLWVAVVVDRAARQRSAGDRDAGARCG